MPEHDPADHPAAGSDRTSDGPGGPGGQEGQGGLGGLIALRLGGVQVALLARVLAGTLAAALPQDMVRVRWRRSPADRLARRDGQPVEVTVVDGPDELVLRSRPDGVVETRARRTVGGVRLSDVETPVADWLRMLGALVERRAAADASARAALERFVVG